MDTLVPTLNDATVGSHKLIYFMVDRSVQEEFSPSTGYQHIFYTLNDGISWSGVQVPKYEDETAQDIQVFALPGYGESPLALPWRAAADYYASHDCVSDRDYYKIESISSIFAIYAHHLVTPEVKAATRQLQPSLSEDIMNDRDGIVSGSPQYGVKDYYKHAVIGRDLYAQLSRISLEDRATYVIGHSLGGIAAVKHSIHLTQQPHARLAGCFTFGLVAGFSSTGSDNIVPGFLGKLLGKPSGIEEKNNQNLMDEGKSILALKGSPEMWFNPKFVKQYQEWNLLEHPEDFREVATQLTIITADKDGMAQPKHVEELCSRYQHQGMKSPIVIEGADHLFVKRRGGTEDNRDVLAELTQHLNQDFKDRRNKLAELAA